MSLPATTACMCSALVARSQLLCSQGIAVLIKMGRGRGAGVVNVRCWRHARQSCLVCGVVDSLPGIGLSPLFVFSCFCTITNTLVVLRSPGRFEGLFLLAADVQSRFCFLEWASAWQMCRDPMVSCHFGCEERVPAVFGASFESGQMGVSFFQRTPKKTQQGLLQRKADGRMTVIRCFL